MDGADLWRAALAAALILLGGYVAAVYVIAFGLSLGAVFFNPAANSVIPALVRDHELIRRTAACGPPPYSARSRSPRSRAR